MQTFLISTTTVALAEIGDKTQLLSLILAAKYRKPWPICIGILAATLVNHALAGSVGALVASYLTPEILKWIVALSFFAVAAWTLKPDMADDEEAERGARYGVLLATVPVVWLGSRFATKLPLRAARVAAAVLFAALGVWILVR